jgi:hypothetical protein
LVYHVRNPKARLVEFICGLGGSVLDEVSGKTEVEVSDSYNWRVYQRNRVGGVVQPGFTDITNTDRCKVVNGRVVITQTAATQYFTVRTDKRFYARDYLLNISDGQLQFSLQMQEVSPGQPRQEAIGLGQWDVMLNGFSLIRGLHYFIEGTTFTITARDYIDNTPGFFRLTSPDGTWHADLYGTDVTYHGKVDGLGVGTGSAFSLLPAQNATGNWIKVVQRVPVRISIDSELPLQALDHRVEEIG